MNAESNIEIIIPTTQKYDSFKNSNTYKCIKSVAENCKIHPICENSTGLSELYQNVLNESDNDIVLFMHDDLEIHDHFLVDKLIKAHEIYDIVGLAGSTTQNYNTNAPMVWHLCREKPEHSRGIVNHYIPKGFNNVEETHINSAYFGPTPSRVCVIDGLFMSFKMSSLKNKGEVFDREFTFHHYDLGLSCNAYDKGLSMGVWPIFTIHHGLGEFSNDPTWHNMAKKFKQKYGNKRLIV